MKFKVTMKDPDALIDAMDDLRRDVIVDTMRNLGVSKRAAEAEASDRLEKIDDFVRNFFEYGEYLTVEFDIDAKTATVLKRS